MKIVFSACALVEVMANGCFIAAPMTRLAEKIVEAKNAAEGEKLWAEFVAEVEALQKPALASRRKPHWMQVQGQNRSFAGFKTFERKQAFINANLIKKKEAA